MRRLLPRDSSEILLIVNNLVPVVGALALGWKAMDILFFYVTELVVFSLAYYLKLCWVLFAGRDRMTWADKITCLIFESAIYFFLFGLAFVTIVSIVTHLGGTPAEVWKSPFGPYGSFLRRNAPALLAILASQGASFVQDFLRTKSYRRMDWGTFSTQLLWRILPMVAVPLALGVTFQHAGFPDAAWSLAVLILAKSGFDLWSHRRSKAARPIADASGTATG